jgi:NitT/TauT family transport system substrate-binding protein
MNAVSRRTFVASTSALAAAAVLSRPIAARAAEAVRMGYIADFNGASLAAVATDQNMWAGQGLAPDLKVFTNGPIQIQAFGSGSLDFGYIGPGALWLPASGRAAVIAINCLGQTDRVIAQAGVRSMADLKGKPVGVPEGTSGDMLLRLALQREGMTIDDLQLVRMDPSTVVAAFSSRQIVAAGIWYPLVGVIKERVPDLVELAGNGDFFPKIAFPSVFVARTAVPDALTRKVITVLKKANAFRAANLDKAVEITSKFIGVGADKLAVEAANTKYLTTEELQTHTANGTAAGWLTTVNRMFKDFGRLPDPLDPKKYFRADLYAQA